MNNFDYRKLNLCFFYHMLELLEHLPAISIYISETMYDNNCIYDYAKTLHDYLKLYGILAKFGIVENYNAMDTSSSLLPGEIQFELLLYKCCKKYEKCQCIAGGWINIFTMLYKIGNIILKINVIKEYICQETRKSTFIDDQSVEIKTVDDLFEYNIPNNVYLYKFAFNIKLN